MNLKLLLPWMLFISCFRDSIPDTPSETIVAIQALDCSPEIDLILLSGQIEKFYNCKCVLLPEISLPENTYLKQHQRYRADSILNFLDNFKPDSFDLILAVTSKDISTSVEAHKDRGVFGLGRCPGKSCVISDFRLHKKADKNILQTRLKNVALHELGHNFGLIHCGDTTCLMKDANGKLSSVEGAYRHFCRRCHERIYD